jgi:hypothetical protein
VDHEEAFPKHIKAATCETYYRGSHNPAKYSSSFTFTTNEITIGMKKQACDEAILTAEATSAL